jgi:hypothetical protein
MKIPISHETQAEIPVGTIVVMGDVLTADGGVREREVALPIRLSPVEGGLVEPEVRRELTLLEAAKVRERALEARTAEEFDAVRRDLRAMSVSIGEDYADDVMLAEEAVDLERMVDAVQGDSVGIADAKYMKYRARYANRGRASARESISRERWEKRRKEED